MMSNNERMNKLANAGVNTGKYFNINLPEGLAPGATISVVINENGQPVVVNNQPDPIAEQIITNGYVRNTKLHRRFVMAQMFHMLNYKSYDGKLAGYTDYLNLMYGYDYTLKMMLEEVKVLSRIEISDKESFDERSHFFTKEVVLEVLCDYVEKLKAYVDTLPTKKCKGVPYKKVNGMNVFVDDLAKKIFHPLMSEITYMKYAKSYSALYGFLKEFVDNIIKLPYDTPKSKAWVDAFKGAGAYYTLKNLVMYHGCTIPVEAYRPYDRATVVLQYKGHKAMEALHVKLDEYKGEGWRMFALMKKVIKDNDFNFDKKMAEIYSK